MWLSEAFGGPNASHGIWKTKTYRSKKNLHAWVTFCFGVATRVEELRWSYVFRCEICLIQRIWLNFFEEGTRCKPEMFGLWAGKMWSLYLKLFGDDRTIQPLQPPGFRPRGRVRKGNRWDVHSPRSWYPKLRLMGRQMYGLNPCSVDKISISLSFLERNFNMVSCMYPNCRMFVHPCCLEDILGKAMLVLQKKVCPALKSLQTKKNNRKFEIKQSLRRMLNQIWWGSSRKHCCYIDSAYRTHVCQHGKPAQTSLTIFFSLEPCHCFEQNSTHRIHVWYNTSPMDPMGYGWLMISFTLPTPWPNDDFHQFHRRICFFFSPKIWFFPPKTMIFTIHFRVPLFLETPIFFPREHLASRHRAIRSFYKTNGWRAPKWWALEKVTGPFKMASFLVYMLDLCGL